jgi:hypothetical protein
MPNLNNWWAALHDEGGAELTPETAPGYTRVQIRSEKAEFPAAEADWGAVYFYSVWSAPVGGKRALDPPTLPLHAPKYVYKGMTSVFQLLFVSA